MFLDQQESLYRTGRMTVPPTSISLPNLRCPICTKRYAARQYRITEQATASPAGVSDIVGRDNRYSTIIGRGTTTPYVEQSIILPSIPPPDELI